MLLLLSVVFLVAVQDGSSLSQGQRCMSYYNRAPGVCMLPSECPSAGNYIQEGPSYPTFCSTSLRSMLICCSNSSTSDADPDADYWDSNEAQASYKRVSERKCEEYNGFIMLVLGRNSPESILWPSYLTPCMNGGLDRVFGGVPAFRGEFPHMAAIGYLNATNDYEFDCGGSLISPRFVLTAGHCTKSTNKLLLDPVPQIVRLGDHNIDPNVHDGASPIDVRIKAIHKHPKYDPPKTYHDIALIELDEDVKFNDVIRPACLWTKPDFLNYTTAIATGWGIVNPKSKEQAKVLQKVRLTLMQNDFCDQLEGLRQIRSRKWDGFSDGQLCAGELNGKKDTCQGDSGAPLQVSPYGRCVFHVIGVTSFGRNCGDNGKPAVYTRVSSYVDWIESVVWPGEQ